MTTEPLGKTTWKHIATFEAFGQPKGQPRAKARAFGKHAQIYNPKTADNWKAAIAMAGHPHKPATPLTAPLRIEMVVRLPRPQRLMGKKHPAGCVPAPCKPDIDNILKGVLDALTVAGWWTDDQIIVSDECTKVYHAKDGHPGAVVRVLEMEVLA